MHQISPPSKPFNSTSLSVSCSDCLVQLILCIFLLEGEGTVDSGKKRALSSWTGANNSVLCVVYICPEMYTGRD